jgi:hypothetical protein
MLAPFLFGWVQSIFCERTNVDWDRFFEGDWAAEAIC